MRKKALSLSARNCRIGSCGPEVTVYMNADVARAVFHLAENVQSSTKHGPS